MTEYDLQTNSFPRDLDGTFSDYDVYIKCHKGIRIFYLGSKILQVYVPSLGVGRNILKAIYQDMVGKSEDYVTTKIVNDKEVTIYNYDLVYSRLTEQKFIFNIEETDSEVLFCLNYKDVERLEKYIKFDKTSVERSPFSPKSLPKIKYNIPSGELLAYKQITSKLESTDIQKINIYTNNFIKTLVTKKRTMEDIKADMRLKCIKGKDYIHSIGLWNKYLEFLDKQIGEYIDEKHGSN